MLAAAAIAVAAALAGAPAATAAPRCFGAAAMDRLHRCSNPTRSVVPRPDDVGRERRVACRPTRRNEEICTFGTRAARARRTIALVGDSHALQWRPALDVVARSKRWRAFSVTTAGCFFSAATASLPVGLREPCSEWYRSTLAWLRRHPEISTVFVSQRTATPVAPSGGRSELEVKIAGFRRAWRSLPRTVRRVIVIRDTPVTTEAALDCVRQTLPAGGELPGVACRVPRAPAMSRDPAVLAVRRYAAGRYRHVDLTSYFCSRRNCFPVIGGVLVHRDVDHITRTYSRTLGPYLTRKVSRHLPG